MLAHGVCQGVTGLDIGLDGLQTFFKGRVGLLLAENLQALDQGKTGIDHGGQLSGKDDQVLAGYLGLKEFDILE